MESLFILIFALLSAVPIIEGYRLADKAFVTDRLMKRARRLVIYPFLMLLFYLLIFYIGISIDSVLDWMSRHVFYFVVFGILHFFISTYALGISVRLVRIKKIHMAFFFLNLLSGFLYQIPYYMLAVLGYARAMKDFD